MAEEHDAWLAKLGVKISVGGKDLKDSDFPTDARGRKAADEQAAKLGKQRRDAMNQEKGEGPPEEEESFPDTLVDKAEEKVKGVIKDINIPKFGGDAEE